MHMELQREAPLATISFTCFAISKCLLSYAGHTVRSALTSGRTLDSDPAVQGVKRLCKPLGDTESRIHHESILGAFIIQLSELG